MKESCADLIVQKLVCQLADLRKKKQWSYHHLAKQAGITHATISHLENNRRKPSLLLALKLVQALDVQLSHLLKKAEIASGA